MSDARRRAIGELESLYIDDEAAFNVVARFLELMNCHPQTQSAATMTKFLGDALVEDELEGN